MYVVSGVEGARVIEHRPLSRWSGALPSDEPMGLRVIGTPADPRDRQHRSGQIRKYRCFPRAGVLTRGTDAGRVTSSGRRHRYRCDVRGVPGMACPTRTAAVRAEASTAAGFPATGWHFVRSGIIDGCGHVSGRWTAPFSRVTGREKPPESAAQLVLPGLLRRCHFAPDTTAAPAVGFVPHGPGVKPQFCVWTPRLLNLRTFNGLSI